MSKLAIPFVMRRAASVLQIRGWHQGSCFDVAEFATGRPLDECAVCAVGAINVAVGNEPSSLLGSDLYIAFLADVLEELFGLRDIAAWNDTAGRTADEVTGLLEAAAVRAEQATAVAL